MCSSNKLKKRERERDLIKICDKKKTAMVIKHTKAR